MRTRRSSRLVRYATLEHDVPADLEALLEAALRRCNTR
jgi:hypothetical protein